MSAADELRKLDEAIPHVSLDKRLDEHIPAIVLRNALPEIIAVVEAAEEAVDTGDEINRCRICWKTWGEHADDCPLPALAAKLEN